MIIDKGMWVCFFKGYEIYDATYGYEHGKIGLLLTEVVDEDHDQYDDPWYTPEKKLLSIIIDNPPESRIFSIPLSNYSSLTLSSGWQPSQPELVIAASKGKIASYKIDEYEGPENKLDNLIKGTNDKRAVIARLVRVGTNVYAICSGLRIYKRIKYQQWQEITHNLPVPNGFIEGSADGVKNSIFYDLAGFSESDMYAVGGMGIVYHYNGLSWLKIPFNSDKRLHTVCCADDGFVYISDNDGSIWKGRKNEWTRIINQGTLIWPFKNMVWFDNRLWCGNHQDIKVLEDGQLIYATQAKHKPLPDEVDGLGNHKNGKNIEVSPDGSIMMISGSQGVAIYDGNEWKVLLNLWKF
ncbi:hypothetical protein P3O32_001876 [Salmonella enterica]|nr:hypothetical protein [Salmonella enterica]